MGLTLCSHRFVLLFFFLTDIDDCELIPCKNGGLCRDGVDSYTCECNPGFEGEVCQTSELGSLLIKIYSFCIVD